MNKELKIFAKDKMKFKINKHLKLETGLKILKKKTLKFTLKISKLNNSLNNLIYNLLIYYIHSHPSQIILMFLNRINNLCTKIEI
jgi:hypothetical protein